MEKLLEVSDLHVAFPSKRETVRAVDGVSFQVFQGETFGLVGESGCGKSQTLRSILGLLKQPGRITGGEIRYKGADIAKMSQRELQKIRGKEISMIFQEPMTSLNPVYRIERQLGEVFRLHEPNLTKAQVFEKSVEILKKVGVPKPEERLKVYPHQLSGGLRQRVMIAISLASNPQMLIADEPTTALDVTIQAQILNLIKRLNRELDMTTILITHDLGVVATLCDKVVVMYGGLIMEDGTVEEIFYHPKHPYTMGLIDSIPRVTGGEKQRLKPIPGTPPNLIHPPKGCPFSTRCPYCMNVCMEEMPPYFQEDGHRTMCWLLHEEAPVNPEYVQRKEAMRRADG